MNKKKNRETNPPPTKEEFENLVRNVMFNKPPTLKEIKEMNKAKKDKRKK